MTYVSQNVPRETERSSKRRHFANGHVYPQVDKFQWGTSYAQQITLFRNLRPNAEARSTRSERVPAARGSGLALALSARVLAAGDLDGDGKIDAVVNNIDSAPTVLKNLASGPNHCLSLKLVGDITRKTPKDAIGSKIFVTAGGIRQRFDIISGASYASQSEQRVHVGLGSATKVDEVEIVWSNGESEAISLPGIDRSFTIQQGKGVVAK